MMRRSHTSRTNAIAPTLQMTDALGDLDDVQSVTANFEMAEELMAMSMV
jgi:transcriptional/translational regulatory protein YebC/TACO1